MGMKFDFKFEIWEKFYKGFPCKKKWEYLLQLEINKERKEEEKKRKKNERKKRKNGRRAVPLPTTPLT